MRDNPITVVEFCAGYAGLGLGLKGALGSAMRSVAYCELEGFAQANLVSKMEAGLLDAAPVWSDLRTFPYAKFRGLVDIAAAGIPCQPHSHAGKRLGGADERFLFDEWLDGLQHMHPRYIFIENVEGLLSSKMPDGTLCVRWTVERLEGMGYMVAAGLFSAAEVGAPHQRKRVFILAHRFQSRLEGHARDGAGRLRQVGQVSEQDRPACEGGLSFWPSRPGEPQHEWEPPRVVGNAKVMQRNGSDHHTGIGAQGGSLSESRDAGGEVCMGEPMQQGLDGATWKGLHGTGRSSVEPATGCWPFTGWQAEPALGRDADGPPGGLDYAELCVTCDNRTDELRLLGNGVVPAVATKAFITLWNQLHIKPNTTQ